ncbi:MAG: PilZ domain-containing protein [Gammaproteobacteria bacterium]|nr:PilZ domain-containing protein [Gammaproteobacteria bacterium]
MIGSRTYTEKRDFHRMVLDCPVSYSDVDGLRVRSGRGINLSARGIAFEASESFPVGSLLKVNVEPQLAMTQPLSALIKVLRVERDSANQCYKLAGSIEEFA